MSFRNTFWLFAAFLTFLWLFGLVLEFSRTQVDQSYIVPTLQAAANELKYDAVIVSRNQGKKPEEFHFRSKEKDFWVYEQNEQAIKVEAHHIEEILRNIRNAKHEAAVGASQNLADYGLNPPTATVTILARQKIRDDQLGPQKEWKFFIGKESPDRQYYYVNSSDRPNNVFAVPKQNLDKVFFTDVSQLRSRRLFDFAENIVQSIQLKKGDHEVEIKKIGENTWQITKPELGIADYEGPLGTPSEKTPSVKSLINDIVHIRVDAEEDFLPAEKGILSKFGLEDGKETLRIQVVSSEGAKIDGETLLVGQQEGKYYYARLSTDEGVFKVPARYLEPVLQILQTPGKLRSTDLVHVEPRSAERIRVKIGSEEGTLQKKDKSWTLKRGSSIQPANPEAVQQLLEGMNNKRGIVQFFDVQGDQAKKLDAELGLESPRAEIALMSEEKKKEQELTVLRFGRSSDPETVPVQRISGEGLVSRFTVPKRIYQEIFPESGLIGFLALELPSQNTLSVGKMEVQAGPRKLLFERKGALWYFQEGSGATPNLADPDLAKKLLQTLTHFQPQKWIEKIDAKEELESYGLKSPSLIARVQLDRPALPPSVVASVFGLLGAGLDSAGLLTAGSLWAQRQMDPDEALLKFGQDTVIAGRAKRYGLHSGKDLVFLADPAQIEWIRDADFRDRSALVNPPIYLSVALAGLIAAEPWNGLIAPAPIFTGAIHRLEPSEIQSLKVAIRTPQELRKFTFVRKDKSWADQSNLEEFQLNPERVEELAKQFASLRTDRFVSLQGGPRDDQKLTPKDSSIRLQATLTGGKSVELTVGAAYEKLGYFAESTAWPGAVFFLPAEQVQPLLQGVGYLSKDRLAKN